MNTSSLVYTIVYGISYAFNGFIVYIFLSAFFSLKNEKYSKTIRLLGYIGYILLTASVYLIWDIAFVNLICSIICLFGLTFLYSSSIKEKLLAVGYTYLFLFASEVIVYLLTSNKSIPVFNHGYYKDVVGAVACRILAFIFALLFRNIKTVKQNQPVPIFLWISSLFVPLSTMTIETVIIYFIGNKYAILLSVIIVVLLNIVSFALYDALNTMYRDKMQSALIERERELYQNQCIIMQTSVEEMKKFRHDIRNQLSTLYELNKENKQDDIKSFINELISINEHGTALSNSGNIILDSILNYHLRNFYDMGIDINVDVSIPARMKLDAADMTTIFSNMIDNAKEALSNYSEKHYSLKVVYSKGSLIIIQRNSTNNQVIYDGDRIVTSKPDKHNHGYGLRNIEDTAKKYGGFLRAKQEQNEFVTDVLLYIKYE